MELILRGKTFIKNAKYFRDRNTFKQQPRYWQTKIHKELIENNYVRENLSKIRNFLSKQPGIEFEIIPNFSKLTQSYLRIENHTDLFTKIQMYGGVDIVILFKEITITNGTLTHTMEDLCVKIPINPLIIIPSMKGCRFKVNYIEYNNKFLHCHLPTTSNQYANWEDFCLGTSVLYQIIKDLRIKLFSMKLSDIKIQSLFFELENYLKNQTTETTPYIRISDLLPYSPAKIIANISKKTSENFTVNNMIINHEDIYISNGALKMKWSNSLEKIVKNKLKYHKREGNYFRLNSAMMEHTELVGQIKATKILFQKQKKTCIITNNFLPEIINIFNNEAHFVTPDKTKNTILNRINNYLNLRFYEKK
jgi:hypothetical protein